MNRNGTHDIAGITQVGRAVCFQSVRAKLLKLSRAS